MRTCQTHLLAPAVHCLLLLHTYAPNDVVKHSQEESLHSLCVLTVVVIKDIAGTLMSVSAQDTANLVVLDSFFGAKELQDLLTYLTGSCEPSPSPSSHKWERKTADDAHASETWGLKADLLEELAASPTEAMIEIQSRLVSIQQRELNMTSEFTFKVPFQASMCPVYPRKPRKV